MSVYDLYQSYLNQLRNPVVESPVTDPNYLLYLQQQQNQGGGGEGFFDPTNTIGTGENLGINSLSDAFSAIQGQMTPGSVIGGLLGGIPGALIGRGIGSLVDRFRGDPYGGFSTKGISPDVQTAIEKDIQRESKDYGGNGGKGPSSPGRSDPYGGGVGGVQSF